MKQIHGTYFDGLSSKPFNVIVSLSHSTLKIISTETDRVISLSWERARIKNIDFSSTKGMQLQYGDSTKQTLIIDDESGSKYIKEMFPEISRQNIYNRLLKDNIFKTVIFSFIVMIGVAFLYFSVIAPYISQKVVNLIPLDQEIVLGDKMYESIEPYLDIDEDKSATINRFYKSLHFKSDYPVEVIYSNSNEVNAFAIPGGKIVIHEGLVNRLHSWEELAALISHELAHVEKRHSLKSLSRNLSTYFVISVITTDISGISTVFVENAFKLKKLSNSRSFEQEADEEGFKYLVTQKINPKGMVDLFKALQNTSPDIDDKNVKKALKIISTHPLTEDRINNMERMINETKNQHYLDNSEAKEIFSELIDN